ncbi:hypothetical protein ACFYO7_22050 [Nocardia salmonicida]|uniref:hypothetical protein n=1 Tax=Nocardia salmonicida TaxID=53431 RepID=UPI00367C6BB0
MITWVLWVAVVGIPAGALVAAIFWPSPKAPKHHTVDAIRQRVEREAEHQKGRRGAARSPW